MNPQPQFCFDYRVKYGSPHFWGEFSVDCLFMFDIILNFRWVVGGGCMVRMVRWRDGEVVRW